MHILFADKIDENILGPLRDAGHELTVNGSITAEDLPHHIGDADVVVVRSTRVTAEAIAAGTKLGLIVRAGAGTDNVDKEAASARGVYVCNVPGRNAIAVAELTIGLMLAVDRSIADQTSDLRQGVWDKARYTKADGIAGKNMAILGVGEIGLAVAERAKALAMTVTAVRKEDRSAAIQNRIRSVGIRLVDDQAALLAGADVISIHVPKDPATTGLVDSDFLAQLPDDAIILNTSRGDVVNEGDLVAALDSGRGLRAGLDVYANEPNEAQGVFDSQLAKHHLVVGTHHIGASTSQSQQSVALGTVEVIEAYTKGAVINCVNLTTTPTGLDCLVIRHIDRVGVLAKVLGVLRGAGMNIQQMQNQVFVGTNAAAVATIHVSSYCDEAVFADLNAIDEVFSVGRAGGA